MRVVIDADVITYRVAWSCEDRKTGDVDPDYVLYGRINNQIHEILEALQTTDYQLYLTGPNNFRYDIYPGYKANRPPKPKLYEAARIYMISKWGAVVTDGIEADDALSIEGSMDEANVCIASIDKDLLQIPCWHYNFVKGKLFKQDYDTAIRSFYAQLLMGDATDSIPGIKGIGPVKAGKLLQGTVTEYDMLQICVEQYREHYGEEWKQAILCNGRLLYMLRDPTDMWGEILDGSYHTED